ncbi:hypothetical protein DW855_06825 [Faecalibacterium prausnitzii]|uniref:Uncharacterized protein n=1 Tax=Faecalibacterium prausnitzii TaxID=853 RepID=A0A3E2W519_9FIRM|nr:hypothetical protein [Faecalibacterium prausnitzii]RGC19406.1 hypothetical protein DW855_06825 [Faecalibacterium prausnitzii]
MKELFEIYDGSAEAKKAKGKSKNLSGFHPLFTAAARRSIALDALKIWLLLGFIVGVVTGVATGAGAVSVFLGLLIAAVIYFGFRDDVYKKVYGPEHDRGQLPLPEGMSWEEAVDRIRRGFANPDVEQATDTADAMTFYSKKRGTYQLKNTADGLKMTILTKPSKSSKKEYLYAVFSSVLLSQVIAILYPEKISAEQVEEEKAAVRKMFGAHKMPLVIELAITAAFVAFAAYVLYTTLYSDSARSKCISDSYLNLFPEEATVGEVLDDFFTDGKWDNYEQNGVTYVSYTGIGQNTQTGEKIEISIYFKLNNDKTFGIDRMTWNGDTMNTLEQLGVISALNDSYRESHDLASSNALDSAFDELENALDEALTDSASSEAAPESEAVSTSVTESVPYTETADAYDADDVFSAATRFDEQATSTNGMDTYSKLAGEISVEYNHYDELTEEIKEYFLSYGPYFRTAWLNAMYTDIYEDTGRYGNATALYDFVKYMSFYDEITSYYDPAPMSQAFHDVILSMEDQIYVDTATDREAAPYVDEVIQTAEANGAELQIW